MSEMTAEKPEWFNANGMYPTSVKISSTGRQLTTTFKKPNSKKTSCIIKILKHSGRTERYTLYVALYHKGGPKTKSEIPLSAIEFSAAFSPERESASAWGIGYVPMVARYKADTGVPGRFIRKYRYLNIPCPGCGEDGDPNASVHLSEWLLKKILAFKEVD